MTNENATDDDFWKKFYEDVDAQEAGLGDAEAKADKQLMQLKFGYVATMLLLRQVKIKRWQTIPKLYQFSSVGGIISYIVTMFLTSMGASVFWGIVRQAYVAQIQAQELEKLWRSQADTHADFIA